jgi:hypothetical protein
MKKRRKGYRKAGYQEVANGNAWVLLEREL